MAKTNNKVVRVAAAKMSQVFETILLGLGFNKKDALTCALTFTENSLDGVYTHGVYRFPRFVEYIKGGYVLPGAKPVLKHAFGNIEQWSGELGPGILNALHATGRAMELAKKFGLGCVTLSDTNHWMRGGTYGWKAAEKGLAFIGWTNTIANMPAWGAKDARLGNNPLVLAVPYKKEAIVLDMAMSQFSFGALEKAQLENQPLSVFGGIDEAGELTRDAASVLKSGRPIPVGYWKGAGLALLLDILAAIFSGGLSTHDISKEKVEIGLSQVFIAIDLSKFENYTAIPQTIENIIKDYHQSLIASNDRKILYPGERVLKARKDNTKNGIPVVKKIWDEIVSLQ